MLPATDSSSSPCSPASSSLLMYGKPEKPSEGASLSPAAEEESPSSSPAAEEESPSSRMAAMSWMGLPCRITSSRVAFRVTLSRCAFGSSPRAIVAPTEDHQVLNLTAHFLGVFES